MQTQPAGHTGVPARYAPISPELTPSGIRAIPASASSTAPAFDRLYIRRPRAWLVAILVAYAVAALSYALNTPAWQAPDEPAHYNYIAHIAQQRSLPVLQMGDYDQALLEGLKSSRFNPPEGVERIRYESHQPPLYYLLATPVYWSSGGNLLALRLFGVLIGLGALLLLYLCLELIFPTKTLIVVGATAFAALLPMHVAMLAAVNNDGLAELLVMASMLAMLSWMRLSFLEAVEDEGEGGAQGERGRSAASSCGHSPGTGHADENVCLCADADSAGDCGDGHLAETRGAAQRKRQSIRGRRGEASGQVFASPCGCWSLRRCWRLYGGCAIDLSMGAGTCSD